MAKAAKTKVTKTKAAASKATTPKMSRGPRTKKTADFRQRQVSVAAILDETFGELAKCDPDLWERRAYLMLIGLVYEKLATCESTLPTDELISLAKALAENRRANARPANTRPGKPNTGGARNANGDGGGGDPGKSDDRCNDQAPPTGELPEHFARAVRQIYGIGD